MAWLTLTLCISTLVGIYGFCVGYIEGRAAAPKLQLWLR